MGAAGLAAVLVVDEAAALVDEDVADASAVEADDVGDEAFSAVLASAPSFDAFSESDKWICEIGGGDGEGEATGWIVGEDEIVEETL